GVQFCGFLTGLRDAQEDVHGALVEALVGEAAGGKGLAVEGHAQEGLGATHGELGPEAVEVLAGAVDLLEEGADLGIGVPATGLVLEDEVGAHAAAGELDDVAAVGGAEGVGVEVAEAVVPVVFQQFDEEEGGLDVGGAEAEI